ncbi:hypothetical protein ACFXKC_27915 [Streptomyces sp. NPDC059340]|uniref:hypothetical protein n=1 Tax=Streptomyces sp. NPDC059340 TaxID=3346806 RepID=UPI0036B0CF8E
MTDIDGSAEATGSAEDAASLTAVRVRAVVEGALGHSLAAWPQAAPLAEFPLAAYDSLMQLEAVTRLEKEFCLATGALDTADVATLQAATARLVHLTETP